MFSIILIKSALLNKYIGLGDQIEYSKSWKIQTYYNPSDPYKNNGKWNLPLGMAATHVKETPQNVAHFYTKNSQKTPYWHPDVDSINIDGVKSFELRASSLDNTKQFDFIFEYMDTIDGNDAYNIYYTNEGTSYILYASVNYPDSIYIQNKGFDPYLEREKPFLFYVEITSI